MAEIRAAREDNAARARPHRRLHLQEPARPQGLGADRRRRLPRPAGAAPRRSARSTATSCSTPAAPPRPSWKRWARRCAPACSRIPASRWNGRSSASASPRMRRPRDDEARRGPPRRHLGRARGEPRLRPAVHRGAARGRLRGRADRRRPATSARSSRRCARRGRTSCSTPCTAASARMAASRACWTGSACPTPDRASAPPRSPWTSRRRRRCSPPPACRSRRTAWSRRPSWKPPIPLPLPYVVKPAGEGSSVGVHIIRERRQPPGADRARLDLGRAGHGRALRARPRDHGRRHGRPAARGDRDRHPPRLLRLRSEIRRWRQPSTPSRRRSTRTRRRRRCEVAVAAHRALGCRGVSRADFRYDDTAGEPGRAGAAGGQHPARHDPHLAWCRSRPRIVGIAFPELCAWMVEQARHGP